MPKTADAIKGSFGVLKNMKLEMKDVAGWETVLNNFAEYETLMIKITEQYPKAKETANNPNLKPGPAFTQFLELQQKARKLKQDLKAPVEKLEQGRQKLYDLIKKITDKSKADPLRARLQDCNTQFNLMLVMVRQTTDELEPIEVKAPLPASAPSPSPNTSPSPQAANQYAKTPNQYAKTPNAVKPSANPTPSPSANQYAKTPNSVKPSASPSPTPNANQYQKTPVTPANKK